jgi:hypothetical protein
LDPIRRKQIFSYCVNRITLEWLRKYQLLFIIYLATHLSQEHAVTQLVEALRYKPESRGLVSRRGYFVFPFT